MQRVNYVHEGKIYFISNHAVARNPLFSSQAHKKRFLDKLDFYLSPYCHILQYRLQKNQFQLLIKLKSRGSICTAYITRCKKKCSLVEGFPKTTYIFSQAMANLQSSTAIWFNRKHKRSGALFARRFAKYHVHSINSYEKIEAMIRENILFQRYYGIWRSEWFERMENKTGDFAKSEATVGETMLDCGMLWTNNEDKHPILRSFLKVSKVDLEGHFRNQVILTNLEKNPP